MPEGSPAGGGGRGVRVDAVAPGSPAEAAGVRAGDRVLAVSGKPVDDLLDLHFLTGAARYTLRWAGAGGTAREKSFRGGVPLGLFPEPVRVRRCRNRCIFCFVHQLPPGLRRSLYVKDEDVRLSFLAGQYVTFTDVTEEELRRIVRYRLSPLYVSIHTADPVLRRRMLGNPRARDVMEVIGRLTRAGIVIHGQIVVCPGVNDGEELARTLRRLASLRPNLSTVAVVPVGLTAHRKGLPPLRPVAREEARATLRFLDALDRELGRAGGEVFAQPADEYFILAGAKVPGRSRYGGFHQVGNGVGLVRRFLSGARALSRRRTWPRGGSGGTVVTGRSAAAYVGPFLEAFSRRAGAPYVLLPVENRLFGPTVTVTGLLPGRDILSALRGTATPRIFVPSVCLREGGDLFLDGLSPGDLEAGAGAPVTVFEPTPAGFLAAVREAITP